MAWGFTDWLAGIARNGNDGGADGQVNFTPVEELVANTPPPAERYATLPEGLSNPQGPDPTKAYKDSGGVYTVPNGPAPVGGFWSPDAQQTASAYLGTPYEVGYYDYVRQAESQADDRNSMWGRGPNAANEAVNRAYGVGDSASMYGRAASDIANADANMYQGRQAQQGDWAMQNNALGMAGGYGTSLAGLEAQQGPSAAQAQLQQGTNQAMGSQIALARSGRGFGGSAAAAGLAQGGLASVQANQTNAAAQLRAQEDAAWRQRQAGNLASAAGIQQGIGQQYGQQVGTDLTAYYQNQGQNDAAALASRAQGNEAYFQGANANINAQTLGSNIRGQELNAGLTREDNFLRQQAAKQGWDLAQQQRQDQQDAAYIQMFSTGVGMATSDIRAKDNITRTDAPALEFARAGSMVSPKAPDTDALDAVARAPGYGYVYEDPSAPGAAPGQQYGPMAQDLAATPAGRTAVVQGKDGQLGVDTDRLSLVNTSAISAQQRKIDELEAQIAAFSAQPGAVYPLPSRGSF